MGFLKSFDNLDTSKVHRRPDLERISGEHTDVSFDNLYVFTLFWEFQRGRICERGMNFSTYTLQRMWDFTRG